VKNSANISGDWIEDLIRDFIATSPQNTMKNSTEEAAWDDVLVGFASGSDSIWQQYKEYIGAFHWTPWEVFNQHCPQESAGAEELTVISWVLPQRALVRKANRREFNAALRKHVAKSLEQTGHAAIAPMLVSNWTIVNSQRFSYASSWSERHAAHAAGLGTFGLCMRVGSVVAKLSIEATPRPYSDHRAYCLYFDNGTCGKCIDRCPVRAITETGHDKEKCRQHLARSREYVKKTYKFEGYGCGLCQVGVPCEAGIPVKAAREALERGELPPPPPPLA
jgi:ferredoxin